MSSKTPKRKLNELTNKKLKYPKNSAECSIENISKINKENNEINETFNSN